MRLKTKILINTQGLTTPYKEKFSTCLILEVKNI